MIFGTTLGNKNVICHVKIRDAQNQTHKKLVTFLTTVTIVTVPSNGCHFN